MATGTHGLPTFSEWPTIRPQIGYIKAFPTTSVKIPTIADLQSYNIALVNEGSDGNRCVTQDMVSSVTYISKTYTWDINISPEITVSGSNYRIQMEYTIGGELYKLFDSITVEFNLTMKDYDDSSIGYTTNVSFTIPSDTSNGIVNSNTAASGNAPYVYSWSVVYPSVTGNYYYKYAITSTGGGGAES